METGNYPAGTIIDGRYRIVGRLGRGGFATVYQAEHLQLGRQAALKVLEPVAPHITERFQARFKTEARIAANLDHPNVVRIFDFGFIAPDDRPYMAMEMLEGRDLEAFLREVGSIDPERAKRLFLPILDALRLGHERGIVHKDLKPSNLYVVKEGTEGEKLIVLDYGIARLEGDDNPRHTEEGTYTGTPAYMPPEYIHRREVTPAYDVYQIGLIFIEAMTGQPVVKAGSQIAYMVAHVEGKHRVPEGFGDFELGAALLRAISVDPALRYAHGGAMLEAVTRATVDRGTDFTLPAITLDEGERAQITDRGAGRTTEKAVPDRPRSGMSLPIMLAILVVTGGFGCLLFSALLGGAYYAMLDDVESDEALVSPYGDYATSPLDVPEPVFPTMPNIGNYPSEGQEMQSWLLSRYMILATLYQVDLYAKLLPQTGGWSAQGASFVPSGVGDLLGIARQQIATGLSMAPQRKALEKEARGVLTALDGLERTLVALYDYHSVVRGWESDGGARGKALTKELAAQARKFRPIFDAWSMLVDRELTTHLKNQEDRVSADPFLAAASRAMLAQSKLIQAVTTDAQGTAATTALADYDVALGALSKQLDANRASLAERYQITMGIHERFHSSLKETRRQAGEIRAEVRDGEDPEPDMMAMGMQLHMTFDVFNQLQRF